MSNTIDTLIEAYIANCDYEVTGDATKARLFLAAAMKLDLLKPTRVTIEGNTSEWNPKACSEALTAVRRWLAANGGAAPNSANRNDGRHYYDMSNIRGD